MAKMSSEEYVLWRTWRFDREKFRQLGVWGGDENGEIGQGKCFLNLCLWPSVSISYLAFTECKIDIRPTSIGDWSLAGWDGHSPFHPTKPGARSLRSEGGGFNSPFRWDPFLGSLSDVRKPDHSGSGKGLHKLLGEDNPQVRMWELQLAAVLQDAGFSTDTTEEKTGTELKEKSGVEDERGKLSFIVVALQKE